MFNVVIELYHISELFSICIYENIMRGGDNMYEKFAELLKRSGVTTYRVSKETKIPANTFTDWKNGRSKPKLDKLLAIARYFGVPVEYFADDEEAEEREET